MAICSQCGSELKEGAKFCTKCGSNVIDEQKSNVEVIENIPDNEYIVKYLMVYDDILKRYRYSKAKVIGALFFAWCFIIGFFSLLHGLIQFSLLGSIFPFIISLIIGIVLYAVCSFIGDFVRQI